MALALGLLLLVLQIGALPAWGLTDQSGHRFSLLVFEQPDPAFPAGWRLRVNALAPGLELDHNRPLLVSDGMGALWSLPNRSEELVPPGADALPPGSAQFDADALVPRPGDAAPLRLQLPTAGGEELSIMLGPELVESLHNLPVTVPAARSPIPG
jgi:hypothetical protein